MKYIFNKEGGFTTKDVLTCFDEEKLMHFWGVVQSDIYALEDRIELGRATERAEKALAHQKVLMGQIERQMEVVEGKNKEPEEVTEGPVQWWRSFLGL